MSPFSNASSPGSVASNVCSARTLVTAGAFVGERGGAADVGLATAAGDGVRYEVCTGAGAGAGTVRGCALGKLAVDADAAALVDDDDAE